MCSLGCHCPYDFKPNLNVVDNSIFPEPYSCSKQRDGCKAVKQQLISALLKIPVQCYSIFPRKDKVRSHVFHGYCFPNAVERNISKMPKDAVVFPGLF